MVSGDAEVILTELIVDLREAADRYQGADPYSSPVQQWDWAAGLMAGWHAAGVELRELADTAEARLTQSQG